MTSLASGDLRVELLDPTTDQARLGPRFCWGGFIWQVHHRVAGPLFTGPEWPEPTPLPFNAQGLPESFRHKTRAGRPLTWQGDRGVALGAGELVPAEGQPRVVTPCTWTVTEFACGARFRTVHSAAGFEYELERTVELLGDELRSSSRLVNRSERALTLEWFAHPFFALTAGRIALQVPTGAQLPENPGFALSAGRFTQRRDFHGKDDGQLELLTLPPGEPLTCRVAHPRLTHIDFATSFAPSEIVVWGNGNTFSIEPYLALHLAPGESRAWHLSYRFGSIS
jgi:hypothetical protein